MSLTKSVLGKVCILALISILQVCSAKTSKADNSTDVTTSSTEKEAESKIVETAVKLEGQETYQISKTEPYPHNDHGYIQQSSLYKSDPYKSESQSSHDDSFELYKQRYLSNQAPAYHTANQDSHHSGYESDGYSKDGPHQEQVQIESDYGYHQSGPYEVDGYHDNKNIPYGTKLPVKSKEKSYPGYAKEIGYKQRQQYGSYSKYGGDKTKYIAQEVPSKEYNSKSYYENSDSGKGDIYVSKEQPYSSGQGETSYGYESPQITQQLIYDPINTKHSDGKSGYSSNGAHASSQKTQQLVYEQPEEKNVNGKSGYSSQGGYASPQIVHQFHDQLDSKHGSGKSGYNSYGGHASAQQDQQLYDQTNSKSGYSSHGEHASAQQDQQLYDQTNSKSGYSSHGEHASAQQDQQLYDQTNAKSGYSSHGGYAPPPPLQLFDQSDAKYTHGKSGYSSHGGQEYAQQHQQLYDQTDAKPIDGKLGYDSHGSHQPAIVTSYYYRGIKTQSTIPIKSVGTKYVSTGQEEYFPTIPKEAGYITSVNEPSYVQDTHHGVLADDHVGGLSKSAILKDQISGVPGDGKVAIYIKQLGHSSTGDKYGKGGERHGFLLLPVLPNKHSDAVQSGQSNFYNIDANKYDNIHQVVDTSAYGHSPIHEDRGKTSTYKGTGVTQVQELKSVYQSPESYYQGPLVTDVGKTATYSSSYGGESNGKSSQYDTHKGNAYAQDTSANGDSSSYKGFANPSSYKGSTFRPIIQKSNQIISAGYASIHHEPSPEYTIQKPHQNLEKSTYQHPAPQQYSKGNGFQPSYYFPPTSAPKVPLSQNKNYGKSETPKPFFQHQGYNSPYENVQIASGYFSPKSSTASQKRVKSYAIVLQRPQEQIQVNGYGTVAYPAASVRKSKLLSGTFPESQFKPIIGKSSTLNSRRVSLSLSGKSQTGVGAYSPVEYSQRVSKKY